MRSLPITAAVAATVALAMPAGARAASAADQRDPRELDAKTACLAGRTTQGIELLAALYAETNDPIYIYNQARCFEQNGKAPEAVSRFREYLRKATSIAAEEKNQVSSHISEIEEQMRQVAAPPPPPPVVAPPAQPPAAAPPVAAESSAVAAPPSGDALPTADTTPRRARVLRMAAIAAGAVSVAGVAGGIFMWFRARDLERQVNADASQGTFSEDKFDDGQQAETLQWVGYGLGAAGLIAGGVLLYLGERAERAGSGQQLTALPLLGPNGAGASLRMVF